MWAFPHSEGICRFITKGITKNTDEDVSRWFRYLEGVWGAFMPLGVPPPGTSTWFSKPSPFGFLWRHDWLHWPLVTISTFCPIHSLKVGGGWKVPTLWSCLDLSGDSPTLKPWGLPATVILLAHKRGSEYSSESRVACPEGEEVKSAPHSSCLHFTWSCLSCWVFAFLSWLGKVYLHSNK
jgi:hypothetical protein